MKNYFKKVLNIFFRLKNQIYYDKYYFEKILKFDKNKNSINFKTSLIQGNYNGIKFLLKYHKLNLIESSVYKNLTWEINVLDLIGTILSNKNYTMLDIGANIGTISIPLAKLYSNSKFLLFEPHPEIFQNLIFNVNLNDLSNMTLINKAVSDNENSKIPFYAQKDSNNMGLSSTRKNKDINKYDIIEVDTIKIDSLVNEKIKIIKIDTQGNELSVLYSGKNTITRDRPFLFFEFESEYYENKNIESLAKKNIIIFFKELKYKLYYINKDKSYFPEVNLNHYFNGDIIAIPDKL